VSYSPRHGFLLSRGAPGAVVNQYRFVSLFRTECHVGDSLRLSSVLLVHFLSTLAAERDMFRHVPACRRGGDRERGKPLT
jgi:hypothetical protein